MVIKEIKNTSTQSEEIDKRFLWPDRDFLIKCPNGKHEILVKKCTPTDIYDISTSPWYYLRNRVYGLTHISIEIFPEGKGMIVKTGCPLCPPGKGRFAIIDQGVPKLP